MKKTEKERYWRELENRKVCITTLRIVPLLCSTSFSREYRQTVGRFKRDELGNKYIIHLILFRDSKH